MNYYIKILKLGAILRFQKHANLAVGNFVIMHNDIVNITLHNSLKNFEDIGHWNKYPRSVAKWIFIPMRRAGR